MVTIAEVTTFQRRDGIIEAEAVVTAKDGDSVTSGDLDLATISRVKAVQPLAAGYVAGAAAITNPESLDNHITLTLYKVTAGGDSLEAADLAADSKDWMITAQQLL